MAKIEIDSRPVEVSDGLNLIEAGRKINVEIPHYCYHSGLTVVGSCRMCQVEVEVNGRKSIAIACNTTCADGMKVTTKSETVHKLRRSVLEFYLQHHPLDCPICDDAGECDLQNYYMEHGLHDSRMKLAEKKHKHKVMDVGPTVVLDSERCVLCSRCVRFCREIVGVDELGIFGVGNSSELLNTPGKKLENDYSGCVVDLCPVGALTDKDFRFKRRVWYMKRTASICTGCSRGCNTFIDWETSRNYKDSDRRIQRLKPRFNRMVNEWWMCDRGRYLYHDVDAVTRLTAPRTKAGANGHAATVDEVISRVAARVQSVVKGNGAGSIAVIASANSSNEDLFVLKKLFADNLKVTNIDVNLSAEEKGKEDDILRKADWSPNRRGAMEIGVKGESTGDEILESAKESEFEVLIVVRHDIAKMLGEKDAAKLRKNTQYIVYLGTHDNATAELADEVIPISMWGERACTYTNFQGRVQKTSMPFEPIGFARDEYRVWLDLASEMNIKLIFESVERVFDAIGESVSVFKGLTWDGVSEGGRMLADVPEPAYRRVQTAKPLPAY